MFTLSNNKKNIGLLFVCIIFMFGATRGNQTLIRGDYDGDGYQDLAVALVRPLGGNQYRTEMLARGSSGKQVFYTLAQKTDAFANGKYFEGLPTALASVLVTSISEPLLWTFVEPQTSRAVQLRYGIPGDTITNAINFDGDSLDDIFVVRNGSANEFSDGKTYLHWYVALTGSNGQVADILFGMAGDRVFTFYKDGKAHLGAVRIENSGVCAGQFAWYYMAYDANPTNRKVGSTCWGLTGDIPIIPAQLGSGLKVVISRPTGGIQVAYIRNFDGNTSETQNLGLSDSIPGIAALSSSGPNFFWHQRSTPALGDLSFVGIRGKSGSVKVIQFGITSNVILRPDGSVIQPTDSGRLSSSPNTPSTPSTPSTPGSTTQCGQIITSGYLWKPASQDTGDSRQGYPLILFSRYFPQNSCLKVLSADFKEISCLGQYGGMARAYEGFGCGLSSQSPCNGRTSASSLAEASKQLSGSVAGYVYDPGNNNCYQVSNLAIRIDRR